MIIKCELLIVLCDKLTILYIKSGSILFNVYIFEVRYGSNLYGNNNWALSMALGLENET